MMLNRLILWPSDKPLSRDECDLVHMGDKLQAALIPRRICCGFTFLQNDST